MQCNYLGSSGMGHDDNSCVVSKLNGTSIVKTYNTTDQDREKYCYGENFRKCPRYIAALEMNNCLSHEIKCHAAPIVH